MQNAITVSSAADELKQGLSSDHGFQQQEGGGSLREPVTSLFPKNQLSSEMRPIGDQNITFIAGKTAVRGCSLCVRANGFSVNESFFRGLEWHFWNLSKHWNHLRSSSKMQILIPEVLVGPGTACS